MKSSARESWEERQMRLAKAAASKGTEAYTRLLDIAETTTYPVESACIARFLKSMGSSISLDLTALMGVNDRTYSLMVRCLAAYRLRMYTSWPLPNMNWERMERLTKRWDAILEHDLSAPPTEDSAAQSNAAQREEA